MPPPHRRRVHEWIRRYLPYEIISAAAELGGAGVVYAISNSLAAAALAGTLGAVTGYYTAAFLSAARLAYRQLEQRTGITRIVIANALALRSVTVEFGLAECVDSLTIRPATYYLLPTVFESVITGWVFAKLISDVAFYLFTIISYEKCGHLLVRRPIDVRQEQESR